MTVNADYAIITVTQFNRVIRVTQIRLRNSSKRHYADYANTDFNYVEILVITQWTTC